MATRGRSHDAPDTHRADTHARAQVAAKDLNRKQREALVLAMRLDGLSFAEIAHRVGYHDQSGAYKAYRNALAAIPKLQADMMRDELRLQLEDAYRCLRPRITRGDERAVVALVQLQERYSKLMGLDKPVQPPDAAGGQVVIRAYPAEWVALTQPPIASPASSAPAPLLEAEARA